MIFDLLTNTIVMGSIPNISGTPEEQNIKQNVLKGLENTSKVYPTIGTLKGTQMLIGQTYDMFPSKQNLDKLSTQKLREMANTLYPFIDIKTLNKYSREQLIKMIKKSGW